MAETVGWLADKISIVELKIYHMREQADRPDADAAFRERCEQRLGVLRMQRDDLAEELTTLLRDIAAGRVVPKVYRQFKMYNDPAYRRRADSGGQA
ncbi:MAG TPA: DUF4254 domain-containing protein [Gemmatimonadaceae bacterium]|nr:DUF4254 domain-containing protein [Gemmatimonadaceae bacterium]